MTSPGPVAGSRGPRALPAGPPSVVDPAAAEAFGAYVRTGQIQNSMTIGVEDDGGVTVPTELASRIDRVALLFSPMRQVARVVRARSGEYEQVVSTTAAASEWRAETDTRQDTATPTLKSVKPTSGELSAVAPITWLTRDSRRAI